jgi:hypothetical protein
MSPRAKRAKTWHFTPHQFRRFFSILYVWRYQLGDLSALSYHLRHTDIVATRRYVTEAAAGLLVEEEREFTKTILREAALGERKLGGAFGERFQRMLERWKSEVQKKVRIVPPERLEKWVEKFVSASDFLLKSNPWSYCVCPETPEGAARANCRKVLGTSRDTRGADFANAAPHICVGCFYNCTDLMFKPYIEEEIRLTQRRLEDPSLPSLVRNAETKRLSDLVRYLEADFRPQSN